MNLIEAGVVPAIPAGGLIGALLCRSHGVLAIIGGSFAGIVSGAAVGFIYAFFEIILIVVFTMLWRSARKLPRHGLEEAYMDAASQTARPSVFLGILIGALLVTVNWRHALTAMLVMALTGAISPLVVGHRKIRQPLAPKI